MKSRLCTQHSEGTMFLQEVVIEVTAGLARRLHPRRGRHCELSASHIASSRPRGDTPERSFSRCLTRPGSQGCVVVFGNCGRRAVTMGDCLHYRRGRSWNAGSVGGAEFPDPAPGGRIPRV